MLNIRQLDVAYGRRVVVRAIDLELNSGDIIALIGPNGAGKTTLLRTLAGFLLPSAGHILLDGQRVPSRWDLASNIAYVPTEVRLPYRIQVRTLLKIKAELQGVSLDQVEKLECDAEQELGEAFHGPAGALSRGQKLKLAILLALVGSPDWVVADEPWAGLDPLAREWALGRLMAATQAGTGILVSSHDLAGLADLADQFVFLFSGSICRTIPRDQLHSDPVIAAKELFVTYRELDRVGGGP